MILPYNLSKKIDFFYLFFFNTNKNHTNKNHNVKESS